MKVIRIVKYSLILILFGVFVACSFTKLKEFLSRKIGSSVSFETREKIPLPSWTLCPFSTAAHPMYNKSNVHKLVTALESLPVDLLVSEEDNEGNSFTYNMTDAEDLEEHFNATLEDTWNVHCKGNYFATGCNHCITFNAPRKQVGKFIMNFNVVQKLPEFESFVLELHDRDSSLALNWNYNWNQVLYFEFKPGET